MRLNKTISLTLVVLIFTVPWLFFDVTAQLAGMPAWAFYAVVAAAIYSIVLSLAIEKSWPKDDNDE